MADSTPVEKYQSLFSYIISEENCYRTERVPLSTNWRDWNMFEHIDRSFTLKNSKFYRGAQDYSRPFNNIILPIANVNYRTEGFDVKNVELYVNNAEKYHKSFVARKFHDKWAVENDIDTAIDESVESYFDYGLTLVKNVDEARPEVVDLQIEIAFCDQTNILGGPLCLKDHWSISELLEMKGKWDDDEIDRAILMAQTKKDVDQADGDSVETPGKYLKIYELHGTLPETWLKEEVLGVDFVDTGKYVPQMQIVTFFVGNDGASQNGINLFKAKEPKPVFKALKRDPIYGRACGRGGIEELFHSQIWTNYSEIHLQQMLEAVSKVILITTDKKLKNQKLTNTKHGQVITKEEGKEFSQLPLQAINKTAFDNFVNKWEQVGRSIGAASDPSLGINPVSGTPLGTTEIVTAQGQGIHEYRQGKIAVFWAEIYRDWVLPHLAKEINKGSKWLAEFTLKEMQEVSEQVATKQSNDIIKKRILNAKPGELNAQVITALKELPEKFKQGFMRSGDKKFIEIVKDEFEDLPMDVKVNIANKQKNTPQELSKLNSIFRAVFTPQGVQILQQPGVGELFNEILEGAGLSPVNFAAFTTPQELPEQPTATPPTAPKEELALTV